MLVYAADADALDAAERDALLAHLASGCPRCAGALAEAEATVAQLPLALDRVRPPKPARDRLMQRVLADASSAGATRRRSGAGGSSPWLALAAAAAVILLLVSVVLSVMTQNYKQRLAVNESELVELRQIRKLLGSSNLDMLKLASTETRARGRIFWDHDNNRWRVEVFDLAPPAPGREFELWFITPDQQKIPAGTFRVDASGKGVHEVDVPKNIGPIALAAITDEPIGGVMQPTGSIHLAGKVEQ
jgi:anti-sigma-K factor RskA